MKDIQKKNGWPEPGGTTSGALRGPGTRNETSAYPSGRTQKKYGTMNKKRGQGNAKPLRKTGPNDHKKGGEQSHRVHGRSTSEEDVVEGGEKQLRRADAKGGGTCDRGARCKESHSRGEGSVYNPLASETRKIGSRSRSTAEEAQHIPDAGRGGGKRTIAKKPRGRDRACKGSRARKRWGQKGDQPVTDQAGECGEGTLGRSRARRLIDIARGCRCAIKEGE